MKVPAKSRPSSPPTLQIIAEKSGVSRETVSHILGGKLASRYKETTRTRVLQVAEELNYRPHRAAQAMKTGRSNLIAIVHFGAGIEAAHKTNLALSRFVNENGYDYLAMDMNWYGGCVERTLAEIIRARVEGVLISHIQKVFQEHHVAELKRAGIPVVSVNGEHRSGVPLFCDDARPAFRELTDHLIDNGCRRILQPISSTVHLSRGKARSYSERTRGFQKAMQERGTWLALSEAQFFQKWPEINASSANEVIGISIEQDPGLYDRVDKPVYRFCSRLFPMQQLPDAIICTNDLYAMEVIAAGLEHGIHVPGDLAVTGYDNDRIGEFPCFGITTAQQDTDGICSEAVNLLTEMIAKPDNPPRSRKFKSKIVIRTSSMPPWRGAAIPPPLD